ncbi:helix-turn-helix domain-containing protein [Robertmurraya korlensis]|uniref:helix-turn-helix domain-containing protein n=1 Tax=Robertmurraya korlensis TaxID=519977 RepID=UPI000825BAE2|nr:helix-turn-helix domain-containing protein [Robertmurraya korlensis]
MTKNIISKDIQEKGKAVIRKQLKDEGLNTQPPVFSVQSVELYDKDTDSYYTKAYIVEDIDFVRDGGLAQLNATAYKVLKIIVAHTDKDGFSFISQQTIADMLGISERQVGSIIREHLLEGIDKKTGQPRNVFYGGRLLLKAIKLPAPNGYKFTMYHPVNCFLDHTPYNFKDETDLIPELEADEDDGIQELDLGAVDFDNIVEKEKPEDTTPEAILMKKNNADNADDINLPTLPLENERATETVLEKKVEKNIMLDLKALADETTTDEPKTTAQNSSVVKFKRGKQTEAGKVQAGANRFKSTIDEDNDKAMKFFSL